MTISPGFTSLPKLLFPAMRPAPAIGADLLIIGTLDKPGNSYFLQITPVRVSDSKTLAPLSATFESTEFFESMLTPLPADAPRLKGA